MARCSAPGWRAGKIRVPSGCLRGEKMRLKMEIWVGVRQGGGEEDLQRRVSGRKWQRSGYSIMPSLTPSRVSHCFMISLWIRPDHISAVMKSGDEAAPVRGKNEARHDTILLKSRAGAPATTPSKSFGNFSALAIPWRPPWEQPRK